MESEQRISLLATLGEYMNSGVDEFEQVKHSASVQNAWFTPQFISLAANNISNNFLNRQNLMAWLKAYSVKEEMASPATVGIVMAGNIPLVGFHDLLCVFASGFKAKVKASSKDDILIKHLVQKLIEWDSRIKEYISFAENLKGCDAYITTGSNNSGRYFEYYFGKFPCIIRRNRTSVAIIDGTETADELDLLADDIQLYFGLGCRNVTKLYVPGEYDFIPLLNALTKYDYLMDYHKYKHNFDYHLTLLIMNNKFYMTNESLILTENESPFSPVSQVHYSFYNDGETIAAALKNNDDIQCAVGHGFIPFGLAQFPALSDYADGVDTMKFLQEL